jgi:hypothetical protein
MVSKFYLAAVIAAITGGALLVEQRHRIIIDASATGDVAVVARSAACPDNDNVPYNTRCLSYISGWFWRANAAAAPATPSDAAK